MRSPTLALLVVLLMAHAAAASDVRVDADQSVGQGLLRSKGRSCFAIVPNHVVANALEIRLTDSRRRTAAARLVYSIGAADIAILQVDGSDLCDGSDWDDGKDLEPVLDAQSTGSVKALRGEGTLQQIPINVDDRDPYRFLRISPLRATDELKQGMSGSAVTIGTRTVGVLLSVDSARRSGRVIRQDYLNRMIAPYFATAAGTGPARPEIAWKKQIGVQSWRNNPLFVGQNVYVGSSGSSWNEPDEADGLYAFDAQSGERKWFVPTDRDFNDVAYTDGLLVGGTDGGEVVAVSAMSGKPRWKAAVEGRVYGRPAYVEGGVAVATGEGRLYLLELRNGATIGEQVLDGPVRAGIASRDTDLWVATEAGSLYQFWVFGSLGDPKSVTPVYYPDEYGDLTLEAGAESPLRRYEALGQGRFSRASVYAQPVVLERKVILGFVRQTSYDYPAVATFTDGGGLAWIGSDAEDKVEDGFGNMRSAPALYENLVICGNPYSNSVYALSLEDGKVVWSTALGQPMFQHWSSPVVAGDAVYVARHDGYLHKLEARTGKRLWSLYLGHPDDAGLVLMGDEALPGGQRRTQWNPNAASPIFATPAVSKSLIAVGAGDGTLYMIRDPG